MQEENKSEITIPVGTDTLKWIFGEGFETLKKSTWKEVEHVFAKVVMERIQEDGKGE